MMIRSEYGKRYESLEENVMGKRKNRDLFYVAFLISQNMKHVQTSINGIM
jgi:hypothetical protein